jgi:hypothetical protein
MFFSIRLRSLILAGLLVLSRGWVTGQEVPWNELLSERPVFPSLTPGELAEESRDQRIARLAPYFEAQQSWLENLAAELNIPTVAVDKETGNTRVLVDFDEDGFPQYLEADNVEAAITNHAAALRNRLPFELSGTGQVVGVWDVGTALLSHDELRGKVTLMDNEGVSQHATHVTGTVIGEGVNAAAIGMAPGAQVRAYGNINDLLEATAEAAGSAQDQTRLFVSNHSYGVDGGWQDTDASGTEGWHWNGWFSINRSKPFGRYAPRAEQWDDLVYHYPYYLPIFSAGNERNDNPEDGEPVFRRNLLGVWTQETYSSADHPAGDGVRLDGYETMTDNKNAKNLLTVGAVTQAIDPATGMRDPDAASVSVFSSWGPTDDGRVKPDVVANGVGLMSSATPTDSSYTSLGGTSMAAPSVTGVATLLMERYRALNEGAGMLAAMLKGVLIHTADDIHNPGPNFQTGWGLVNALSGIHLLQQANQRQTGFLLVEDTIQRGEGFREYTVTVGLEQIGHPFKVTLIWTDPAGEGSWQDDDRSPKLVNDLDLRVRNNSQTTLWEPFVLDRASPGADAGAGRNSVDNVEQVVFQPNQAGTYRISVLEAIDAAYGNQQFVLLASPVLSPPEVSEAVVEVAAAGATETVTVVGDGDWQALTAPNWIRFPNGFGGTGSGSLDIEIIPNFTTSERRAQVVISASGNRGLQYIDIVQEGVDPGSAVELAEAVDQPSWIFMTNGEAWLGQTVTAFAGGDAAVSPTLEANQRAAFATTVEGPGRIRFLYQVDSDPGDILTFSVNGSFFLVEDGNQDFWQSEQVTLGPGPNVLEWAYELDSGQTAGANRAYVDQIRLDAITLDQTAINFDSAAGRRLVTFTPIGDLVFLQARNTPPWITARSDMSDLNIEIEVTDNLSPNQRSAEIEIGADSIGWRPLTVTQAGLSGSVPIEELIPVNGTITVSGTGSVEAFASVVDGEPGIVFSDVDFQEEASLELVFEGPGILTFQLQAGMNNGDYFAEVVNGTFKESAPSSTFSLAQRVSRVHYFPPGEHVIEWVFFKDSSAHPVDSAILSDIRFVPVGVSITPETMPAAGGAFQINLTNLQPDVAWTAAVSDDNDGVIFANPSGSGNGVIEGEILPNYFTAFQHGLQIRFQPIENPEVLFYIPLLQSGIPEVDPAQALDVPGRALTVSGVSRGQSLLAKVDGDALVLGGNRSLQEMETVIDEPSLITFDWQTRQSDFSALEITNNGTVLRTLSGADGTWFREAQLVSSEGTVFGIRRTYSGSKGRFTNLGFVDNVRVERVPYLSDPSVTVPASGGGVTTRIITDGRWQLNSDSDFADWVLFSASQLSGEGSRNLTFSVDPNLSQQPRSTDYVFEHPVFPGLMPTVTFTVNQSGAAPFTTLDRPYTILDGNGPDSFVVDISSNEEWAIENLPAWLRAGVPGGEDAYALTVSAVALPVGQNSRLGVFSINGNQHVVFQVRPEAWSEAYLAATGAEGTLDALRNPQRNPLGDLDGDGTVNAADWLYGGDLAGFDPPSLASPVPPEGFSITVRQTDWLTPLVRHAESPRGPWSETRLRYVGGEWTIDGPLASLAEVQFEERETGIFDILIVPFDAPFFLSFGF